MDNNAMGTWAINSKDSTRIPWYDITAVIWPVQYI